MIVAIYASPVEEFDFYDGELGTNWGLVLPDAWHSFLDFLRSPIDIHP